MLNTSTFLYWFNNFIEQIWNHRTQLFGKLSRLVPDCCFLMHHHLGIVGNTIFTNEDISESTGENIFILGAGLFRTKTWNIVEKYGKIVNVPFEDWWPFRDRWHGVPDFKKMGPDWTNLKKTYEYKGKKYKQTWKNLETETSNLYLRFLVYYSFIVVIKSKTFN